MQLFTISAVATLAIPSIVWANCYEMAAERHGLPVEVVRAIGEVESSFNSHAINRNGNGTFDIGEMQINSGWARELRQYGIELAQLRDPCTNVHVGAWILARNVEKHGWNWNAIGAYNVGCAKLSRAECNRRRNIYNSKVAKSLKKHLERGQVIAAVPTAHAPNELLQEQHALPPAIQRTGAGIVTHQMAGTAKHEG